MDVIFFGITARGKTYTYTVYSDTVRLTKNTLEDRSC